MDIPKGAMSSFDELEANLGGDDELPPEDPKVFFMTRREIAEKAHDARLDFEVMVGEHEEDPIDAIAFAGLDPDQQQEFEDITLLALRMQKEPEEDFGRIVHSKRAMQYLLKGYTFAEKHDDELKQTWMVAPWESVPHERRASLLIFKGVVKALFKVWDNDNPMLKRS